MERVMIEIIIDETKINRHEFTNDIQEHCEYWGVEQIVISYPN